MKGIAEERLQYLLDNHDELIKLCPYAPEARGLLDNLLKKECTELSPQWMPIDNTPMDRDQKKFLCYEKDYGQWAGYRDAPNECFGYATHYCELPEDPK